MDNPLHKIIPVLEITPQRWASLLQRLSFDQVSAKPAPGEWSAIECLLHILDVELVFRIRVEAFLAGQDFPSFDPDSDGSRPNPDASPAELAEKFIHLRADSLKMLSRITIDDLGRRATHAALGPVKLVEMLNEWAAHDLSHTVQAEEAIMQPFIEACGPWHVFFEAHKVKQA